MSGLPEFSALSFPLYREIHTKVRHEKGFDIRMLCSIIGLFSMGLGQSLPFIIFMSILFVCGIAIIVPSMLALVGQLGGNEKGVATSIYTFILFIGASLGPIIATLILKSAAPRSVFVFGALLTIGIIAIHYDSFLSRAAAEKEIDKLNKAPV